MLGALIGLAYVSPSHLSAQQSSGDPFAYCRSVKNSKPKEDMNPPRAITQAMHEENIMWRCQNGDVYGCVTGASGRGCQRGFSDNDPGPGIRDYCRENPNQEVPMMYHVPGPYWTCK